MVEPVRAIEIETGGNEDASTTFASDQLLMLRAAADGVARARVWRRRAEGLLLGRFHRADPASCAPGNGGGLSRRLSGGRVVPAGPSVVCVTIAAPNVNWLDPAAGALKPDQVLNRAVRPLLALLRGDGIDAYYPGRDLVTAGGAQLAHASYTVMRDGVAVVEMQVAESPVFGETARLIDRFDPNGVAGVDRAAFASSTSLAEQKVAARSDDAWAERFAHFAATAFACEATVVEGGGPPGGDLTLAHESAARDFLCEPGPVDAGSRSAATLSMLGMVECSGRLRGDRLTDLRICGDVIAPFHTLDDIASECEGEPLRPPNIRKALARAMARPRSFLLGLRDLDELILRLAS